MDASSLGFFTGKGASSKLIGSLNTFIPNLSNKRKFKYPLDITNKLFEIKVNTAVPVNPIVAY